MIASVRQYKLAAVLLIVASGFLLRVHGLSAQGLNEDEVNKAEAAEAYRQGDFLLNREHPMLLKSLVGISLAGTGFWNAHVGRRWQIAEETSVRLPNVLFGSLTAVVIFALAQEFFGVAVGLIAALIWSVLPLAIATNRIAKEDTPLVFFTWLGYYFYVRAKRSSLLETSHLKALYAFTGISFGLMLASKYFPHYLGLIFLYYRLLGRRGQHYTSLGRRGYSIVFGALALTFLLANPVFVLPSTWHYMFHYVRQETMTHHGYLMMGRLYYNDPGHLLQGMPSYSYGLFLLIKTQLPLLLALVVGLAEAIRLRRDPGHFFLILMFTMWMVPFSLVVVKWFRYMLSLMPTVSILAASGIVKLFRLASQAGQKRVYLKPLLGPALTSIFLVTPIISAAEAGPFYSLYLNPFGLGRVGYYFPHDEFDDVGLREAILEVSKEAPNDALVGGEAPPVFHYYLRRFGRGDLRNFRLSEPINDLLNRPNRGAVLLRTSFDTSPAHTVPVYVIVQEAREYFDNISSIKTLESQREPAHMILVKGVSVAAIYRLDSTRPPVGPNQLIREVERHETHTALLKRGGPFLREKLPGS